MLNSDGIIIFSTKAEIIGYNAFVSISDENVKITGGARHRAFAALMSFVEKNELVCAFIRSQDGNCNHITSKTGVFK